MNNKDFLHQNDYNVSNQNKKERSQKSSLFKDGKTEINLQTCSEDENAEEFEDCNFQQIIQNQQLISHSNLEVDRKSPNQNQSKSQLDTSNRNNLKINMSLIENTPSNSIMYYKREELIMSFINRQITEERKKESENTISQNQTERSSQDNNLFRHRVANLRKREKQNQNNSEDSSNFQSSHLSSSNTTNQQLNQPKQEGEFQKIIKDILTWIVIFTFASIIILIIYSFLKIIIEQTNEISMPHYEIIDQNITTMGITVKAQCKRCQQNFGDINNLIADIIELDIKYMKNSQLSINITTQNFTEWSLPNQKPFPSFTGFDEKQITEKQFFVTIKEKPLEISIYRISTSEKIFELSSTELIYSYLYKEYKLSLPTNHIYGIGENNSNFTLNDGVYTLWNKKNPKATGNGEIGSNSNSYQPVYLVKEISNAFHLIYIRSSSPIDTIKNQETLQIKMNILY